MTSSLPYASLYVKRSLYRRCVIVKVIAEELQLVRNPDARHVPAAERLFT